MGTRHLIMAVKNGETRLAQYGQWDGYPSGQGLTVLKFLQSKRRRDLLSKALDRVEFLTDQELADAYKSIGAFNDYLTSEQIKNFNQLLPLLNRDHGADILTLLLNAKKPRLVNSKDFAGDSLFCEWAYVIDFDKQVLEVYEGFNKFPLTPKDRFFSLEGKLENGDKEYHPVKFAKRWKLDKLPTKATFLKMLDREGE